MQKGVLVLAAFAGAISWHVAPVHSATVVATYEFKDSFAADESGKPALTSTDPLATSDFVDDTVLGESRRVWAFNGANVPTSSQAGVSVSTSGLIPAEDYSVDMVFEFFDRSGAYRRVIDVENRQSDNGFYVDPGNNLSVYPVSGASAGWTNSVYHHIVLTCNGSTVNGYLDGISQFTATTTLMNLDADPTNNPNLLMGFFLDNVVGGGQGEWSSGRVAQIRLWNGVLTPEEAQQVANNPFALPEPTSATLLAIGGSALVSKRRRRAIR